MISAKVILIVAVLVFVLMVIGLALTMREFNELEEQDPQSPKRSVGQVRPPA